jgi:putative transposase
MLVDVHGVLPSVDLVNGGGRAPRDQTDVVSMYPLQLLLVELLQRPIEFAQHLSMRYTERLADAGIAPSVGSRGDSYDNALAESVIGLFKTEVIQRKGPWRHLEAVEFATLDWVDWFNTRRLLEPIGYVPPAEYEAQYYELVSRGGARRHPHLDNEVDGQAAERPQDFLRTLQNEVRLVEQTTIDI